MEKIIEDLNWRYATKQFDSNKKIQSKDLETLKETIRLAPTSYGLQSFSVLIVESKEIREQLVGLSYGQRQVADASHLIVLCAEKSITPESVQGYMERISEQRNVPVDKLEGFSNMILGSAASLTAEQVENWSSKQTYIALGHLMQTCASLKIDATPMEGFDTNKVNELLGLDDQNLTATLFCPVGYRHEDDTAQHAAKVRKLPDDLFKTV